MSPEGSNSNNGTKDSPFATLDPLAHDGANPVSAGDTIVFRGGIYHFDHFVDFFRQSGEEGNPIEIVAAPGEKPVIDASEYDTDKNGPGVIEIRRCDYFNVRGLEIKNYPSFGVKVQESNFNQFTDLTTHHGYSSGLRGINADNYYIARCESYRNFDKNSDPSGGSADGINFAGAVGEEGDPGRSDDGLIEDCIVHHNSDDGIDLFGSKNCTVRRCISFANGFDLDGSRMGEITSKGFKIGGGRDQPPKTGGHNVYRCIGWHNAQVSFGWNGSEIPNRVWNCTAFDDLDESFETWGADETGRGQEHKIFNCIGIGANNQALNEYDGRHDVDDRGNSWNLNLSKNDIQFKSTEYAEGFFPANIDDFLVPTADSAAVKAGLSLDSNNFPSSSATIGRYKPSDRGSDGGGDNGDTEGGNDEPITRGDGIEFVLLSAAMAEILERLRL